jgi:hypothetical protein
MKNAPSKVTNYNDTTKVDKPNMKMSKVTM